MIFKMMFWLFKASERATANICEKKNFDYHLISCRLINEEKCHIQIKRNFVCFVLRSSFSVARFAFIKYKMDIMKLSMSNRFS
mgnify:CR=1 FL=1